MNQYNRIFKLNSKSATQQTHQCSPTTNRRTITKICNLCSPTRKAFKMAAVRPFVLAVCCFIQHISVVMSSGVEESEQDTKQRSENVFLLVASKWLHGFDKKVKSSMGLKLGKGFGLIRSEEDNRPNIALIFATILISGDICPNPGPAAVCYPCVICSKHVRKNQKGISCNNCNQKTHLK